MTAATATPTQRDQLKDLRVWLWAIAGGSDPSCLIEIRHARKDRQGLGRTFYPVTQIDQAAATVASLGKNVCTYVGVIPRTRKGGTAADVAQGHLVWVDLDTAEAVEAAEGFSPTPSLMIGSGNGRHLYWVLDGPAPAAEIVTANKRLAAHLGGDPACTDAARVMRAPATWNHKDPGEPKPCRILETVTETYALPDLMAGLPELPKQKPRPVTYGTNDDPVKRVPPPVYFQILAGVEPGRDGKVCCPVHDDRTPSCHVWDDPDAGWHCFGCGAGGDVYELAARLWNMPTKGPGFVDLRKRLLAELIGGGNG